MNWLQKLLDIISGLLKSAPVQAVVRPSTPIPTLDPSTYAERLLAEATKAGKMPDDFTPEQEYNGIYGYTPILGPDGKAKVTYCNFFVRRVAWWFGWQEWFHESDDQASEITSYMRLHTNEWEALKGINTYNVGKQITSRVGPDYVKAQTHAVAGHLVIAGWVNPNAQASGHVCIIAPEPVERMVFSNKWGIKVPIAVNVGKDNWYGKSLSWAFGEEPELFLYKGRLT